MALLNDITLGQYHYTGSFVHRLDPRTKLIASFFVMTALLITSDPLALLLFLVLIIGATISARLPITMVFRNLKPFIWLFGLTMFFNGFFTQGDVLLHVPLINIDLTVKGLGNGLLYSVRLALLVVFAALLTLSTSPIEIMDGLDRLLNPAKKIKIPTHELTMMMSLSLRFIPTLLQEAERLQKAQVSRGAIFEGNIIKRIRGIIPLILPLFISSFRRADDLAMAMDSRCYAGGEGRTSFKQLKYNVGDYLVMAGFLLTIPFALWC